MRAVAGWHNHPAGKSGSYRFSEDIYNDGMWYEVKRGDAAWVAINKTPLYLITPSKSVLFMSPEELHGPVYMSEFRRKVYRRR